MAERSVRSIGVGLLGFGNVGGGVVKLLADHGDAIEARLGARLEVRAIAVRDVSRVDRVVDVDPKLLCGDVPMFSGKMGRKGGNIAVRVNEKLEKARTGI